MLDTFEEDYLEYVINEYGHSYAQNLLIEAMKIYLRTYDEDCPYKATPFIEAVEEAHDI